MDYDVKDVNGVLHTHLTERAITLMIESDTLTESSPMKKSLMPHWKTIADFPFLSEAIAAQKERLANLSYEEMSEEQRRQHDEEERKFIPVSASLKPRFAAFLHDLLLGVLRFAVVFVVAAAAIAFMAESSTIQEEPPAPKKIGKNKYEQPPLPDTGAPRVYFDKTRNFEFGSVWAPAGDSVQTYVCLSNDEKSARWISRCSLDLIADSAFLVFLLWEMISLAWPLALYGQTGGMRKCGVQLSDASDLRTGFSAFRAYLYLLIGIVTLPIAFLFALACKRTVNELILRLRVIG